MATKNDNIVIINAHNDANQDNADVLITIPANATAEQLQTLADQVVALSEEESLDDNALDANDVSELKAITIDFEHIDSVTQQSTGNKFIKKTTKLYLKYLKAVDDAEANGTAIPDEPTYSTYTVEKNGKVFVFNTLDDKKFDDLFESGELAQFKLIPNERQSLGSTVPRYDMSSALSFAQYERIDRLRQAKEDRADVKLDRVAKRERFDKLLTSPDALNSSVLVNALLNA